MSDTLNRYLARPPEEIAAATLEQDTVSTSDPRSTVNRYQIDAPFIDGAYSFPTGGDEPDLPRSQYDQFMRALEVGTDNIQKTLWSTLALTAEMFGSERALNFANEQVQANEDQIQRLPLNQQAFDDISNSDEFFTWAASATGQALPSIGLSFSSGGLGGVLGRKALEHKIRDKLLERHTTKMLNLGFTKAEAEKAAADYIIGPKAATVLRRVTQGGAASQFQNPGFAQGATIGVMAGSSLPQIGEANLALQEAGQFAPLTAIGAGLLGGALELLPITRLIDKAFPGVDRQIANGFIKDFAQFSGTQGIIEGSTEGAQQMIQLAALAFHDPNFNMLDPTNRQQIIESFAQGTLVGLLTGGMGTVSGLAVGKYRERKQKIDLPQWRLDLQNRMRGTRGEEVELADNTFMEELRGRLNKIAEDTVNPAMNAVRNTFQRGIDEVDAASPALNDEMFRWVDRILAAHDEFIEGHAPVIDDISRYVGEQVEYIATQAEAITDPKAQAAFIEQSITEMEQHLKEVAGKLAGRGQKIAQSLQSTLDGEGISFDDFAELREQMDRANQAAFDEDDPQQAFQRQYEAEDAYHRKPGRVVMAKDEEFLFGQTKRREIYRTPQGKKKTTQHITRGVEALPLKSRKSARGLIERLRGRYPSATDSTFEIVEAEGGGFLVQMADPMQRESLLEDETLWQIQENARISTIRRGQKKEDREKRQAKVKGGRILDVPTLAFEGRKVGAGDNQTLRDAFLTVAGMMYDRGMITGADFTRMNDKFEAYFADQDKVLTIKQARELDVANDLVGSEHSAVKKVLKEMRESAFKTQLDPRKDIEETATALEELKDPAQMSETDRQQELDKEASELKWKRGRVSKSEKMDPFAKAERRLEKAKAAVDKILINRARRKEGRAKPISKAEEKRETARLASLREAVKVAKKDVAEAALDQRVTKLDNELKELERKQKQLVKDEKTLLEDKKTAPEGKVETAQSVLNDIEKKYGAEVAKYASTGRQQDLPVTVEQRILNEARKRVEAARKTEKADQVTKAALEKDIQDTRARRKKLAEQIKEKKQEIAEAQSPKRKPRKVISPAQDMEVARERRIAELKRQRLDAEIAATEQAIATEKDPKELARLKKDLTAYKREFKKLTGKKYVQPKDARIRNFSVKQATELQRLEAGQAVAGIEAIPQAEVKKAVVHMPGVSKQVRNAVAGLVGRASKLLSNKVKLRVLNKLGLEQMVEQNHPHAHEAKALLESDYEFAIVRRADGVMYIMVDDFTNIGRSLGGLLHELGHAVHYDTWTQLNKSMQNDLWRAFVKDVDEGRTSGRYVNMSPERRGKMPKAKKDIKEFNEWMADQFVAWMNNRRAPRTQLEKFMEAVAQKLDQLWAYIQNNAGRFGQLNETYGEFMDAVAKNIRTRDPTMKNRFFLNEAANGAPLSALMAGEGRQFPIGIGEQAWNQIVRRLDNNYPAMTKRARFMVQQMEDLYSILLAPSTSMIRALEEKGITAVKPLRQIFGREIGAAKREQNYHQQVKKMKGNFMNQYEAITKGMSEEDKARLSKLLIDRDRAASGMTTKAAKTVIEQRRLTPREKMMMRLFDDMHAYLKSSGLPIGWRKDYFPRIFDREKLIRDEKKIIKHLTEKLSQHRGDIQSPMSLALKGEARRKAITLYNSLISSEAEQASALALLQVDELSLLSPAFKNMRSRVTTDPFWNNYHQTNLDYVVANYINAAVKRAEFNRAVGQQADPDLVGGDMVAKSKWNPTQRIDKIIDAAAAQGATIKEQRRIKEYVEANLGMFGRDKVSDTTRRVMAGIVAYQNMRTLMFTVFASLPDFVGPAIRSGRMKKSFESVIKHFSEMQGDDAKLEQMARAWGIISSIANHHVMTEYVDNHYMPKTLRKMNDGFFKITGLNFFTDFTRKMALAVGIDYIKEQADISFDKTKPDKVRRKADRALRELGLTATQVNTWMEGGEQVWRGIGYNSEGMSTALKTANRKVSDAMVQFVDESILSPNPSQRPLMASHPGFMLAYHLKGFMYAIHETILKRLWHNLDEAVRQSDSKTEAAAHIGFALAPAVMMMMLTALGIELRELVMGTDRTKRMDGWEYTWTLFERAGLTGIAQLGLDFEGAGARGQNEFAAILGPTIGQLSDLISRPPSQTIPKAIPGASQLPWARNALRDAVGLSPSDRAARKRKKKEREKIAQKQEQEAQKEAPPTSTLYYEKGADVDTQARQIASQLVEMVKENPNYKVSFNVNRLGLNDKLLGRTAAYYVAFMKAEGLKP